jgi:uncharacterized protein
VKHNKPSHLRPLGWPLILALAAVLATAAGAQVPFTRTTEWVNDHAGVLSPADRGRLTGLCQQLEDETSYQLLIVTIDSLGGEPIAEAATRYGNLQQAGQAEQSNGIVMMLAMQDRDFFIATGSGAEATITDAFAGRVFRDTVRPLLQQGEPGEALFQGAQRLRERILQAEAGEPLTDPDPGVGARERPTGLVGVLITAIAAVILASPFLIIMAIIGLIVFFAHRAHKREHTCPRCQGWMTVKRRTTRRATTFRSGSGMRTRTCPICNFSDKQRYTIPRQSTSVGGGGWSSGGGGGGGFSGGGGGGFSGGGGGFSGGGGGGRW